MSETFAYDLLDYPSHVITHMHPSKLAAIARLHGITAASPRKCRLLEVGCGDGLHLLSLAMAYPDSQFVGVDLSRNAVDRGEAMRRALGLENLQLVTADLLTWNPGSEPYDYITAHGFFSWVPEIVRERLLALCNQTLTPAGIAYISYNALPGCHVRRMLAEMMKFHVRDVSDPAERVNKAREFLVWLGTDTLDRDAYGQTIRAEAERLLNNSHPSVLFHDDLSPINQAFSVTDFAQLASAHDLGFLAEAEYHETNLALLPAEARERLESLSGTDRLVTDQYFDFLKGRRFRQSILCRGSSPRGDSIDCSVILGMDVVGHIRNEPGTIAQIGKHEAVEDVMRFANGDGAALSTDQPIIKAALIEVGTAFPQPREAASLLRHARRATASTASLDDDASALSQALYKAFQLGLISLQVDAPRFAMIVTETPLASPLARLQIEMGKEMVANLRPSMVSMDSKAALELLTLLDGKRDHAAILEDLATRMADYEVPGDEGELVRHDALWWKAQLGPTLEDALQLSAKMALLIES